MIVSNYLHTNLDNADEHNLAQSHDDCDALLSDGDKSSTGQVEMVSSTELAPSRGQEMISRCARAIVITSDDVDRHCIGTRNRISVNSRFRRFNFINGVHTRCGMERDGKLRHAQTSMSLPCPPDAVLNG